MCVNHCPADLHGDRNAGKPAESWGGGGGKPSALFDAGKRYVNFLLNVNFHSRRVASGLYRQMASLPRTVCLQALICTEKLLCVVESMHELRILLVPHPGMEYTQGAVGERGSTEALSAWASAQSTSEYCLPLTLPPD